MVDAIKILVQVRGAKGLEDHEVRVTGDNPVLADLLSVVAGQDWGSFLFDHQKNPPDIKAGVLLILNKRMIQPWNADSTPLAEGDHMRIMPVVAGG